MAFTRKFASLIIVSLFISTAFAAPLRAETEGRDPAAIAREARKPLIADFGLGFCNQCKQQAATLKEVEAAYGDRIVVRMVNVSKEASLVKSYDVEMIPLLVFFDASGKEQFRKVGPLPYAEIRDQLARMGVKAVKEKKR
jgi:thioredoxin 1